MSDLKNCPLCGDNNLSTGFDGLLKQHYISCVDCDLTIYGSKTGVIEAWNNRAQDAEVKLPEQQATEKLRSLVPNGFNDLGQGRYIHVYDHNTEKWHIQKVTNIDYACTIRFPSRKSAQAALYAMGEKMNDLLYGQ